MEALKRTESQASTIWHSGIKQAQRLAEYRLEALHKFSSVLTISEPRLLQQSAVIAIYPNGYYLNITNEGGQTQ